MSIYHKHHIVPKHMGGTDDPSNLIQLTIEEHAEAHKKLWEEHSRWQDKIAWECLAGQITNAEAIKQAQIKANIGNTHCKGRVMPKEHREKISKKLKNRKFNETTLSKMSKAKLGKPSWNKGLPKELNPLSGRKRQNIIDRLSKSYEIADPQGETFTIKNLKQFCKENNLSYCGMVSVGTGKSLSVRGWKCKPIDSVSP
jgi:hypothetical protein